MNNQSELTPFMVEPSLTGCKQCGHGETWSIIDPNGVASSTSYYKREDADEIADMLNDAYRTAERKLMEELRPVFEALTGARVWLSRFGEHSPIAFGGEDALDDQLKTACGPF